MTKTRIPLTGAQKEILSEFYSKPHTQVLFQKKERTKIWKDFKERKAIPNINLESRCPALLAELNKAIVNNKELQSAVASECVYAQTLANMLNLTKFRNFSRDNDCLSESVISLLKSYNLTPRYVYLSEDNSRALIQAGSPNGTDGALITIENNKIFTIEFKESDAKTTEADLPKYDETGYLVSSKKFTIEHPNYVKMLDEQIDKRLNFWSKSGSNINDFETDSILCAVESNYIAKKFADVICVEDCDGFLTMIPSNQISLWGRLNGEIRPVGRNFSEVWTPGRLRNIISEANGSIIARDVMIPVTKLKTSSKRGGDDKIHRYKIKYVFFVYAVDVRISEGNAFFKLDKIHQVRPTISAHMHFDKLDIDEVYEHYKLEL